METRAPALERTPDAEQFVPYLTWEEYLCIEAPEGLRFEFESGRLIVSPSGSTEHDFLITVLLGVFEAYEVATANRYCAASAPHSFFMPPEERDYLPDVGIITDARRDRPLPQRTEGAPNIAVEVLSPSTARRDRGIKADKYYEQGTAEYWLFDPEARTAEFRRRGAAGWVPADAPAPRYESPLLPGFALDLAAVWARLDQKLGRAGRPSGPA